MKMDSFKILVVDDDQAICNLIVRFLSQQNYEIQYAYDGKSALEIFDTFLPDLVILDINLPDALGYNICEEMQKRIDVLILMLTSRSDLEDKKKAFVTGADDYLTKPFDLEELQYRLKAILKRRRIIREEKNQLLIFDDLIIDPVRREVKVKNQVVNLTALEFNLLMFLASRPGIVCKRPELIKEVWEYSNPIGDMRVVDVHIGQIRKKIEIDPSTPSYIQTVRGVGYKFESPSSS